MQEETTARRGFLRCGAAAVLFGATTPAASRLADDLSAATLAGLIYLGAAVVVIPRVVAAPPSRHALRTEAGPFAMAVVLGGGVGPVLLMAGLARTSAASASLLLNLELVATLILARVVAGEHLGRRVLLAGVAVVTAAVILVSDPEAGSLVGAALIAGACLAWGVDNVVTASTQQLSAHHVVLAKGLLAGSTNLAIGLAVGSSSELTAGTALAALAVGAIGYGVSIVSWVDGARLIGAGRGQVVFSTAPFVGAALSWLVLGDPVLIRQLAAMALAAAGVGLALRSSHTHRHTHEPLDHDHEHHHDDHHPHDEPSAPDHRHRHQHQLVVHHHPHVPDLHHRHH